MIHSFFMAAPLSHSSQLPFITVLGPVMFLSGYTLLIDVITQIIRKPAASFTLLDTLDVFTLLSFYYHNYLYTSVYSKKRFFLSFMNEMKKNRGFSATLIKENLDIQVS